MAVSKSKRKRRAAPPVAPPPSRGFSGASNPFAETWDRRAANTATRDAGASAARGGRRNVFADRRIGEEGDEDGYAVRGRAAKRARFNLEEEGVEGGLTHMGREILAPEEGQPQGVSILRDDFVDVGEDEGLEEEEEEVLGGGRMGEGGGLMRKVEDMDEDEIEERAGRSRQEIMSEVVAKSKMHKAERQKEKAHVDEETTALDERLPDILRMLHAGDGEVAEKKGLFEEEGKAKKDEKTAEEVFDYERVYQELAGEKRAHATDRTKTEEEKDAEERERLVKLEKIRLRRMAGMDDEEVDEEGGKLKGKGSHRLAKKAKGGGGRKKGHMGGDDLVDDFDIGGSDSDGSDMSSSESESEESSEDEESGGEGGASSGGEKRASNEEEAREKTKEQFPMLNLGGLRRTVWPSSGDDEIISFAWTPPPATQTSPDDSLPFIYTECPSNVHMLGAVWKGLTPAQCGVVLTRLRKCFALSLNPAANKVNLTNLLRSVLQYVDAVVEAVGSDSASLLGVASEQINVLLPHLYHLAAVSPDLVTTWSRNLIEDAYNGVVEAGGDSERPLSARISPGVLLSLRCVARLFPGSDLRHAVVTPLILLLAHCLSTVPIHSHQDAACGCFCASLLLEMLAPAQRFSGELVAFLASMLRSDLLTDAISSKATAPLSLADCISCDGSPLVNKNGKHRLLQAVETLCDSAAFDGNLKCIRVALRPIFVALAEKYGSSVDKHEVYSHLISLASKEEIGRAPLTLYVEKKGVASASRLLNPKFRSENGVYTGRQKSAGGVAMSDMESQRRLRQQLKKESRAASRELRRDADAIGTIRIREDDERDAVRSAKTVKARAFMEQQAHDSRNSTKRVVVGREGIAAAGRKRKKW